MSDVVFKVFENKTNLMIGFDTLANCFGSRLYCRIRNGKVECFYCGRFSKRFDTCAHCFGGLPVTQVSEIWAELFTWDLLIAFPAEKYFFPRIWNEGKPWISRADLIGKYIDFLSERYTCSTESSK